MNPHENELPQIFLRAALIAGELWHDRVYKPLYSSTGEIAATRENSLGSLRKATSEVSPPMDLLRAFGRGKLLICDYFPQHYANFEEIFYQNAGLSIEDYYTCLFAVVSVCLQSFDPKDPLASVHE